MTTSPLGAQSEYIQRTDGKDVWFESVATHELLWVLPVGGVVMNSK